MVMCHLWLRDERLTASGEGLPYGLSRGKRFRGTDRANARKGAAQSKWIKGGTSVEGGAKTLIGVPGPFRPPILTKTPVYFHHMTQSAVTPSHSHGKRAC